MGGGTFYKVGAQVHVKNYRTFLWFELATVSSQAPKYGGIRCTPYEGVHYTISDKITPP